LHNSYKINLHALANTKANRFTFINTIYAINIAKFLNIKVTKLKELIAIKGFNSKQGYIVTYFLTLHLFINKH
jgi:hypothetical protein